MIPPPAIHARLRPVREADLDGLLELVGCLSDSITTLPRDRSFLEDRIHASLRSFYPHLKKPGGENYLFVLENTDTGELLGCSGVLACVGGFDPFFTYEIRTERSAHPPLRVEHQHRVLHLKKNHRGPAEMCSLLLHPKARQGGLGRLLSLGRFHFMAAFPQRFASEVIAELRGAVDEQGNSPFWSAVGQVFFARPFGEADFLSGLGEKSFISDLMPVHPIYIELLPEAARNAIGKVHPDTAPALRLLEDEGFQRIHEVDIFDAGPVLSAPRDSIRTIRDCRVVAVDEDRATGAASRKPNALISNGSLDLAATLASVDGLDTDGATLSVAPESLARIGLAPGQPCLISRLRPGKPSQP